MNKLDRSMLEAVENIITAYQSKQVSAERTVLRIKARVVVANSGEIKSLNQEIAAQKSVIKRMVEEKKALIEEVASLTQELEEEVWLGTLKDEDEGDAEAAD